MGFSSISEFFTTVDKFVNWSLSEYLALGFEFLNSFMVPGQALPCLASHSGEKKNPKLWEPIANVRIFGHLEVL